MDKSSYNEEIRDLANTILCQNGTFVRHINKVKELNKNRNYSAAEDAIRTKALYNHYKEAVICQDTEEKTH